MSVYAAQAQLPQYHAQVFGAEQGIGSGGISDMFKDRQQFLWIVNALSMQRFDGRNVRTYPFEKNVSQALCDRDNRIWALSGGRVWRFKAGAKGFEAMPFDTSCGIPKAVFQLAGRPVCVLSARGLYAWRDTAGRFERLPLSPPPPLPYTNLWRFDVCETTIFYPGKGCVYAYDLNTDRARALPVPGEIPFMHALTPDLLALSDYSARTFWYHFAKKEVMPVDPRRYGLTDKPSIFGITGVAPLGNDRFLMTSRIGACTYDLKTDRFEKQQIYASGKPIELEDMLTRVFIDENGTAWAHNVDGIVAFNSLQNAIGLLRNYHYEAPHAWSNRVIGFAEDHDGNLWFGGAGGFKKLHLQTGKITVYPAVEGATDRLSHSSVRGLAFDGRYIVLGPTDKGVWLFDPKTERFRRPRYADDRVRAASENDFIDFLAVMRNGDIIVCGRFHPYRIAAKTYRMDFLQFPGDNSNMNVVLQDAGGGVWMGTHNGVYSLDEQYRFLAKYPLGPVFCLFPENDKALLVGTEKGLRRLKKEENAVRIDSIPLPGNKIVASILRDKRQRFWLSTVDGLYLSDSDLHTVKKFDFADNIQGLVFNGSASLRASNGMVFLGGINGLNYFYPENIATDDRPLSVTIQSVRLNDRDSVQWWQPAGGFRLPFRYNTLTFEVVAPYYNNAGKVQYRYRLPGSSEAWVNIGVSNQIRLADLPPGNYRLEVAASVTGTLWYEMVQPLAFAVLPPFWQTWPFRFAVLAMMAALLLTYIRFRENRLKKQQQAQLELEKLQNANLSYQLQLAQTEEARQHALLEAVDNQRKAAEAKLQSMRLQMNPHFLFNALNSIQQMTLSGNSNGAALYLSKFSKLLRLVLTHSDHETVSLREEINMLHLYVDLESLRFDDTFEYAITCESELDPDEYKVPPLLIQPFVENAIWHGLLQKEGRRVLKIHFETTPADELVCSIEDNGIGREAARAYNRNSAHTGKGMSVGAGRIETLNRQYGQKNTLEIVDLYAPDQHPAGTLVRITLA